MERRLEVAKLALLMEESLQVPRTASAKASKGGHPGVCMGRKEASVAGGERGRVGVRERRGVKSDPLGHVECHELNCVLQICILKS